MMEHFKDGQHVGYLPYLFVLTQLYAPINVCAFNIADTSGQQSEASRQKTVRVPLWWSFSGILYCLAAFYLSPRLMIAVLVLLVVFVGMLYIICASMSFYSS